MTNLRIFFNPQPKTTGILMHGEIQTPRHFKYKDRLVIRKKKKVGVETYSPGACLPKPQRPWSQPFSRKGGVGGRQDLHTPP